MIKSPTVATMVTQEQPANDDLAAMAQAASSLRTRESVPLFHTPPPIDRSRSWLAERSEHESYGIISETDDGGPNPLDKSVEKLISDQEMETKNSSNPNTTASATTITLIDSSTPNLPPPSPNKEPSLKSSRSSSTSLERVSEQHEDDDPTTNLKGVPPPLPRRKSPSQHSTELPHTESDHHNPYQQTPLLPRKLTPAVDTFIHSLQEPKYTTPLSGDEIAGLYQDFYHQFAAQAEEYIIGTSSGAKSRSPKEVPMQTYREIAEKKRERSLRPSRIKSLSEAAEALACEAVYNKIFSIAFGDDRPRNDYIQNRVRALKAIPITLDHLALPINEAELLPLLTEAGEELLNMDRAKNPRSKLQHLLKTHKVLVAALTEKRSDQTSADSILPALLFTFIHYETPNLWLNMNFIKRFRNKQFLQGEDMYCLTNFEAAIEFLETLTLEALNIDISSIPSSIDITPLLTRPDSDPLKLSSPRSSRSNSLQQPLYNASSTSPRRQSSSINVSAANGGLLSKRLSILYPGDLASNAVNSADQSIKSLSSTVGSSYRFLVGRFIDKQKDGQMEEKYPDTLAEARKVVGLDGPTANETLDHSLRTLSDDNLSLSPARETTTPVSTPPINPPPPFPLQQNSRSRSSSLHLSGNNNLGSTDSIIGKFAGGVMRNFRSPSFGQQGHGEDNNVPETTTSNGNVIAKTAKPIERFLTTDVDSLKISDVKELHADYKRLVNHLKTLNAFE